VLDDYAAAGNSAASGNKAACNGTLACNEANRAAMVANLLKTVAAGSETEDAC
jgi:hypothetical protein